MSLYVLTKEERLIVNALMNLLIFYEMIYDHDSYIPCSLFLYRCVKDFRFWPGDCVSSRGSRTPTWHVLWDSALLVARSNSEETVQSRANWRLVYWNCSRCFVGWRYAYCYKHMLSITAFLLTLLSPWSPVMFSAYVYFLCCTFSHIYLYTSLLLELFYLCKYCCYIMVQW